MSKIHIKILSEDALNFLRKNTSWVGQMIIDNDTNAWLKKIFPQPMFVEKKYEIDDFEIQDNPSSTDKTIDFNNSITLYNILSPLPRYILYDERYWLWLHFDKLYREVRSIMKINSVSTIENMWMHKQGIRRGLMFGVLSRCYYRVALTRDESEEDKYVLTKWIIENPERYRNLTWRSFSSEEHLVRGILKGEKRAIDQYPEKESNQIYPEIAKYVAVIGSVRLLDVISEDDMADMIYKKMLEYLIKE